MCPLPTGGGTVVRYRLSLHHSVSAPARPQPPIPAPRQPLAVERPPVRRTSRWRQLRETVLGDGAPTFRIGLDVVLAVAFIGCAAVMLTTLGPLSGLVLAALGVVSRCWRGRPSVRVPGRRRGGRHARRRGGRQLTIQTIDRAEPPTTASVSD